MRAGDVPMIPASSMVREDVAVVETQPPPPQTYRDQVRQARLQRERENVEQRLREQRNEERASLVQSRREQAAAAVAGAVEPSVPAVQSTVSVMPVAGSESAARAQRARALGTMEVYGAAQRASDQPPPIVVPAVTVSTYHERVHLRRVMRVVAESCPADPLTGRRRWLGLKTFLNYYFASNLKLFLGRKSVVRVFLITTEHDLCGKLYRMDGNRYVLSLVANFDYWDTLLGIACALPDVYFSGSGTRDTARTYLRQMRGGGGSGVGGYGEQVAERVDADMLHFYEANPPKRHRGTTRGGGNGDGGGGDDDDDDGNCEDWPVDHAVAALGIVHLFETIIHKDLKNKLPQYITLAELFTRDPSAVNPFKVELRCR